MYTVIKVIVGICLQHSLHLFVSLGHAQDMIVKYWAQWIRDKPSYVSSKEAGANASAFHVVQKSVNIKMRE